MAEALILSACRTAIGKFQGGLASLTAPQLGAVAVKEALRRASVPGDAVDEVILGNVLQAGVGQNPARQAALGAGIPPSVPPFTVNKVCGSGLKSVMLAAQAIRAGDASVVVAGGMESMTNAPYLLPKAREGFRLGHGQVVDAMIHDGLWDKFNDFHMGNTAELVAKEKGVTREQQDAFAAESQRRAVAAAAAGKFAKEITPVEMKGRKGEVTLFDRDEGPRADTTLESLAKLRPAFQKDGTVTAGNASTINDGAAALVVASEEAAKRLGSRPLARITGYAAGGLPPEWVMMAPVEAVRNLWKRTGTKADSFDLYEMNEPFAAASVAVMRELGLDPAKVNVNGGATALGHPIGASGARILVTLLHALQDRGLRRGVAGLCLGGGNAVALSVEML
ncbi:MAG: acetyl-CoA C-acetyltransferase [Planctomycetaceae bacterium]|nr:acetyl-CoA C-acetyltransferase [Planctomycetota bacterium]NUN51630.1 acetyl-CoA C-acetyltransferase [Planctomycetaceae bacterium]